MTISSNAWQARAAMCELLALSFRYPDDGVLAEAIASGEWNEAAAEIAKALGLNWGATATLDTAEAAASSNPDSIKKELRLEATRLFAGTPEAACSPYEGVWRARAEGVKPLFFVNPHTMAVERFCRDCGLGRPEDTNEPLDAVWTELELLEYLALRAAEDAHSASGGGDALANERPEQYEESDGGIDAENNVLESGNAVVSAGLPGGSPKAAWDEFMANHAKLWMPAFAEAVRKGSRMPFYRQAASLLAAFIEYV